MGETTTQIVEHIRDTRNDLGDNISELEAKLKSAVDWRVQFDARPLTMIGLAFGGGVLLSALLPARKSRRNSFAYNGNLRESGYAKSRQEHKGNHLLQAWETLKSALIGVGTARVIEFGEELIPGFTQELKKARGGS